MSNLPAGWIDDRQLRAELALAAEIVGDAARMGPGCAQTGCKIIHGYESSE